MSVYLIAQITIHDRAGYGDYEAGFMEVFAQFKGELLAVDENAKTIEGDWNCTRTVLLKFPSEADAEAWYHSEAYQALAQHRFAASAGNIALVQGMPTPLG